MLVGVLLHPSHARPELRSRYSLRIHLPSSWGWRTILTALSALALVGCVKAQGPVIRTSPGVQAAENHDVANRAIGATGVGVGVGTASATAQGTSARPLPGPTNSGVDAQFGAVVVDPIRRGPLQANGTVTHLVDGDTVDVAFTTGSGKPTTERIRLIGIDTPETKRPDTPVECFGREASSALAALIPIGTAVLIERDVEERDRYGRLLGYVFRASDGLFVNHEMVRAGMAAPYTFPPNIAYVDVFAAAGDASRAAAVGLWSRCESGHTPATG